MVLKVLQEKQLSPAQASSLAGKLAFLGGTLFGRVGFAGLAPLYRRQSSSGWSLSKDIEDGLRWLLQLLDMVGPREWHGATSSLCGDRPIVIIGDASEPSDGSQSPRCAAILIDPRLAPALLYFSMEIPSALLRTFKPRQKQIAVLELLWALLACVVWSSRLSGAFCTLLEDNSAAENGIIRGMSRQADINCLLTLFWGLAASRRCCVWAERIPSQDNPADCLTKPGLSAAHLAHATDISDDINWDTILAAIRRTLTQGTFPVWSDIEALAALAVTTGGPSPEQ